MGLNGWMAKHGVAALRMSAFEARDYPFSFMDVDRLEDHIILMVCDECSNPCTAITPLDIYCKHHSQVLRFVQCAIAGDLALSNYPLSAYVKEDDGND